MAGPLVTGPDVPTAPFPFIVKTQITGGFGRGSTELGIPTANIPPGELAELEPGVYYGWSQVHPAKSKGETSQKFGDRTIEFNFGKHLTAEDEQVFPMVMSIGWNPYYQNKEKSAEVHILHKFDHTFYGAEIGVVVAGFIRYEQSYDSVDALVADIKTDIEVAKRSLTRPAYENLKKQL